MWRRAPHAFLARTAVTSAGTRAATKLAAAPHAAATPTASAPLAADAPAARSIADEVRQVLLRKDQKGEVANYYIQLAYQMIADGTLTLDARLIDGLRLQSWRMHANDRIRLLYFERRLGMRVRAKDLRHAIYMTSGNPQPDNVFALYVEFVMNNVEAPPELLTMVLSALLSQRRTKGSYFEQFLDDCTRMTIDRSKWISLAQSALDAHPPLDPANLEKLFVLAKASKGYLTAENVLYSHSRNAHPAILDLVQSTPLDNGEANAGAIVGLLKRKEVAIASHLWDKVCATVTNETSLAHILHKLCELDRPESLRHMSRAFASKVINQIDKRRIVPKEKILCGAMMDAFNFTGQPSRLKSLYEVLTSPSSSVTMDSLMFGWYLDALHKSGQYNDAVAAAEAMLDSGVVKLDSAMCERILRLFLKINYLEGVHSLYAKMTALSITPSNRSLSIIVSAFLADNNVEGANDFVRQTGKLNAKSSPDVWPMLTQLIRAKGQTGDVEGAYRLFKQACGIQEPTLQSYVAILIPLLDSMRHQSLAYQVFETLVKQYPKLHSDVLSAYIHLLKTAGAPLETVFVTLQTAASWKRPAGLDKYSQTATPRLAIPMWPRSANAIQLNAAIYSALLGYCYTLTTPEEQLSVARELWKDMTKNNLIVPNAGSYAHMMDYLGQAGLLDEVWTTYQQMLAQQIAPTLWIVEKLLKLFGNAKKHNRVETLYEHLVLYRLRPTKKTFKIVTEHCNMDPTAVSSHFERLHRELDMGASKNEQRGSFIERLWPVKAVDKERAKVHVLADRVLNKIS